MKKNIFKLSALALTGAMALFSCTKTTDVTPTAGKPTVTVDLSSNFTYGVLGNKGFSATVSTQGDTAYIVLTVNGTQKTNAIYVTYQKDDDVAGPWTKQPDGTSLKSLGGSSYDGTTTNDKFNLAGSLSSYTYDVPNDINAAWKLTIPVKIRTDATAKSDVFTIWVTKPGNARFDNPAGNLAYGVAVVTLNYTNGKLINNYQTTLGGALNTTPGYGSLFSTVTGSSFGRKYANDTLEIGSTKYTDFVFNDFTASKYVFGSFYSTASVQDADLKTGFGDVTNITKIVKIKDAGSLNFDNVVNDSDLSTAVSATAPTSNKVIYTSDPTGKVLAFITADGKSGLIKVISASNLSTVSSQITIQVKVQR